MWHGANVAVSVLISRASRLRWRSLRLSWAIRKSAHHRSSERINEMVAMFAMT